MNIAISTLSENPYAPSGAQGYYINLLRELSRVGKEHTFYLFVSKANQHLFGPYGQGNVQKIIFPYSNERQKKRVLTEHFKFATVIKQYGIDVLNTGIAPLLCPCRLVVTMKTMHAYTNPRDLAFPTLLYRRLTYGWTARKADAIISNSESHSGNLKKYLNIPDRKIRLVYEALDHSVFFPAQGKPALDKGLSELEIKRPFILFVSSLWPYKNAETLIEAFAKVRKERKNLMLVIAGYSREESYIAKLGGIIRHHNISDSVVFTSGVSHDVLAKLYQSAEVFVYPSLYETFGLTILESMACGCPVITSNISSMPEIAGEAALLFSPRDVGALSDKILSVLEDGGLRKRMIEKGIRRASQFTWENTARKTLDAFLFTTERTEDTEKEDCIRRVW